MTWLPDVLNGSELVVLILAVIVVVIYLRFTFHSARVAMLLAVASAPALYLALEGTSQFLTIDETYSVPEALDLTTSSLISWGQGALRTTDAIVGLTMAAVRIFYHPSIIQNYVMAKLFHWFLGFVVLLMIHRLLSAHFIPKPHRTSYFLVYMYTALLLPVNTLALKVFNYDILSLALTILTALLLIVVFRTRRSDLAAWCIVIATLAAQEKLVASPLLLLSVSTFAYLRLASDPKPGKLVRATLAIMVGLGLATLTSLLTILVVVVFQGPDLIPVGLIVAFDPIVSWLWPLIEFTLGVGARIREVPPPPLVFVTAFAAYCLTLAMFIVARHSLSATIVSPSRLRSVNVLLVTLAIATGLFGTYRVMAYWAPYAPIAPGYYQPQTVMNGAIWHFGARTQIEHILSFVAFSYAVFVNAVPTVYWACLTGALAWAWLTRQRESGLLDAELLLTGALLLPLGFGLLQVPVGNRYLNVALFALALVATLKSGLVVASLAQWKQISYSVVFAALLCAETLPFRPVYGAFRPIWSNYDAVDASTPEPGRINSSWIGWGEEAMLAGQEVMRQCTRSELSHAKGTGECSAIRLHLAYRGYWLTDDGQVNQVLMSHLFVGRGRFGMLSQFFSPDDFQYTDHDYYVLNRSSIVQTAWDFPSGVQPEFVVEFRGYAQAWVFRGDRLQIANLHFKVAPSAADRNPR